MSNFVLQGGKGGNLKVEFELTSEVTIEAMIEKVDRGESTKEDAGMICVLRVIQDLQDKEKSGKLDARLVLGALSAWGSSEVQADGKTLYRLDGKGYPESPEEFLDYCRQFVDQKEKCESDFVEGKVLEKIIQDDVDVLVDVEDFKLK